MKTLLAALALISAPCWAQDSLVDVVKRDAQLSGTEVHWDLDVDFPLDDKTLKALESVPKGRAGFLAAQALYLLKDGPYISQLAPEEKPVVFACKRSRTVTVTTVKAGKWLEKRCDKIRTPI
jgi:hypothetical protein